MGSVTDGLTREPSLDRAALAGYWRNTNPDGQGLATLDIRFEGGQLAVDGEGSDGGVFHWHDPDTNRVYSETPFVASPIALACRADLGGYAGLLQGNLNMGLLVGGLYRTADGKQPLGAFSREFFARQEPPPRAPRVGDSALFSGFVPPSTLDLEPMKGLWRNSDPAAQGLSVICIESAGEGLAVAATAIGPDGPTDWGSTDAATFACLDEGGKPSTSLLASFDFGFLRTDLQLRTPGGILVAACFNRFFDESGRLDYFTREFFYRRS